jgi:CBS domain-containing protein
LPVVRAGQLVGMVTETDLLQYLIGLLEREPAFS